MMLDGELLRKVMRSPWFTVLGLSMGTAVSNGLARFAYGLILPAMRSDLHWNFTQAGWINTANAIGYLAGAILALMLIDRLGAKRLFVTGMVLMTVTLLASGLTANFGLLTLLRVLAGIGGGPAFVAGAALVSQTFPSDVRRTALAIAIYMGGGGVGVLLSGLALPAIFALRGDAAWPLAWLCLGAMAALATLVSLPAALASPAPRKRTAASAGGKLPVRAMAFELVGYFLFGLGYIVYFTFLVAWMREIGAGPALVAATWGLLGLGIIFSPLPWARVLAQVQGRTAARARQRGDGPWHPVADPRPRTDRDPCIGGGVRPVDLYRSRSGDGFRARQS